MTFVSQLKQSTSESSQKPHDNDWESSRAQAAKGALPGSIASTRSCNCRFLIFFFLCSSNYKKGLSRSCRVYSYGHSPNLIIIFRLTKNAKTGCFQCIWQYIVNENTMAEMKLIPLIVSFGTECREIKYIRWIGWNFRNCRQNLQ